MAVSVPACSRVEASGTGRASPLAELETPSGVKVRVYAATEELLSLVARVCAGAGDDAAAGERERGGDARAHQLPHGIEGTAAVARMVAQREPMDMRAQACSGGAGSAPPATARMVAP